MKEHLQPINHEIIPDPIQWQLHDNEKSNINYEIQGAEAQHNVQDKQVIQNNVQNDQEGGEIVDVA